MRNSHVLSRLKSVRARAVLSLGVVLGLSVTGTFAFWTDSVAITGQTLTAGSIDLKAGATAAGAADAFTTTTLTASAMVPGNTVAQTLVLKNAGLSPLKWTLTGGLTGTDAATFSAAGANGLLVTVTDGSASGGVCSGTAIASITNVPLTNVLSTGIITTRQGPIAGNGGTANVCIQITLSSTAPQGTLSNKTTATAFTFTGTSDVS